MRLTPHQLGRLRRAPLTEANKVRLAMQFTHTTQVQLAAAIGKRQNYISAIARGQYSELPLETSRALARAFGCAIEDLFPAREAVAS